MPEHGSANNRIRNFLKRDATLWSSFIATVVMTVGFVAIMRIWDFEIIDEMWNRQAIIDHVRNMTATQRAVHAWTTGTLDVAYPIAYSVLFIGIALRFFPRAGPWLALPSILVAPVDLIEGFSQVMILNGDMSFLSVKAWATPIKLILFSMGLGVAILALVAGGFRRIRRSP
ncbi:MAG: hypothetical protein AAGJ73_09565 [Pseudomonadota bacterium]